MHCFRAFLDSSSPLHHRGAPPRRWVPQSRSTLSRSERVRATISVFTLTVLRRLINATSANSIKSKQGIVTQVGCPRHVLTRTRTRGAEGQRTQRRMGSNDPSSSTAAGNARLIRQLRGNAGPLLSCSHGFGLRRTTQEIVDFTLASVEGILRNRRINSQLLQRDRFFRLLNKFLKTRIAAQRDPY
jgi:hypothetical protein